MTITVKGAAAQGYSGTSNGVGNLQGNGGSTPIIGSCSVSMSVSVTPVIVTISGTDTNAPASPTSPEFLIGQQQSATISAGEFTDDFSGFSWTVSGTDVFAEGQFAPGYDSHFWIPFSSPDADTSYYSAGFPGGITDTCSATFDAPDGSVWTVTADASEWGVVPNENMTLTPGTTADEFWSSGNALGELLYTQTSKVGMSFAFYVQTPAPFYADEGSGSYEPAQLVDFTFSGTLSDNSAISPSTDGGMDLDNVYPYDPDHQCYGPSDDPSYVYSADSPHWGAAVFAPAVLQSLTTKFQAEMFLVYTPPTSLVGPSYDVPVQESDWTWNTSASVTNGVWGAPNGNPIPGMPFSTGFGEFVWTAVTAN